MKATRINAKQAQELINNVKSVLRLGGFETGKRTNLNKAISYCLADYADLGEGIDMAHTISYELYEKEYQNEIKAHFSNVWSGYEIWFSGMKYYTLQLGCINYLIVTYLGFCNVYRLIEKNEEERFNDQPAITNNGDSKETSISYEGKTIKINCFLSNTKVCKWDNKYPESHNHYIVKFKFEKNSAKFDFFDSLHNFETGQTDKTEIDIFEMLYIFLSDCQIATDCYFFEDFQTELGGTKENYNACKRALQKFERVFAGSGIDLHELSNYIQEKYNF